MKSKSCVVYRVSRRLSVLLWLVCMAQGVQSTDTRSSHTDDVSRSLPSHSGVILLYHHVSTDTPASTSVTPAQFRRHMQYLADHNVTVLPLAELLSAVFERQSLPAKVVAITFDDAYDSIYDQAVPILEEFGFSYSIFTAPDVIDQQVPAYLTWPQLRELQTRGAAIEAHSLSHGYLARPQQNETTAAWHRRMTQEVEGSVARIEAEIQQPVTAFAYPYGEYNQTLQHLIAARGLWGVAQQSGAVGPLISATAIPRFPMATGYDDMSRFAQAVDSYALPVKRVSPSQGSYAPGDAIDLWLAEGDYRVGQLACYLTSGAALNVTTVDAKARHYRVSLPAIDRSQIDANTRWQRQKLNCTAPSRSQADSFYWYSYLWYIPQ